MTYAAEEGIGRMKCLIAVGYDEPSGRCNLKAETALIAPATGGMMVAILGGDPEDDFADPHEYHLASRHPGPVPVCRRHAATLPANGWKPVPRADGMCPQGAPPAGFKALAEAIGNATGIGETYWRRSAADGVMAALRQHRADVLTWINEEG